VYQLGAECVYTWVRDEQRNVAFLTELRHKVEDAGLMLYMVGNMTVGKSDKIHLALPGRDEAIDDFQRFVENWDAPASESRLLPGTRSGLAVRAGRIARGRGYSC
jgi:D-mannonate dehydratase